MTGAFSRKGLIRESVVGTIAKCSSSTAFFNCNCGKHATKCQPFCRREFSWLRLSRFRFEAHLEWRKRPYRRDEVFYFDRGGVPSEPCLRAAGIFPQWRVSLYEIVRYFPLFPEFKRLVKVEHSLFFALTAERSHEGLGRFCALFIGRVSIGYFEHHALGVFVA